MTESQIVKQIIAYLRSQGFYVFKISDRFRSGSLDLYCCRSGKSFWLEVKNLAGKVSPLQEHEIKQLNNHGICAGVVRSVEDVKEIIKED